MASIVVILSSRGRELGENKWAGTHPLLIRTTKLKANKNSQTTLFTYSELATLNGVITWPPWLDMLLSDNKDPLSLEEYPGSKRPLGEMINSWSCRNLPDRRKRRYSISSNKYKLQPLKATKYVHLLIDRKILRIGKKPSFQLLNQIKLPLKSLNLPTS